MTEPADMTSAQLVDAYAVLVEREARLRQRLADQDRELVDLRNAKAEIVDFARRLKAVSAAMEEAQAQMAAHKAAHIQWLKDLEDALFVAKDEARADRERYEIEWKARSAADARIEHLVVRLAESERRRLEAERRASTAEQAIADEWRLRPVGWLARLLG